MTDIEALKVRLQNIKENALSEMSNTPSCKDIIKRAVKKRFPGIPERANDILAAKLMDLDNNEILQMGKDQITVKDLINDIVLIINDLMAQTDEDILNLQN